MADYVGWIRMTDRSARDKAGHDARGGRALEILEKASEEGVKNGAKKSWLV